MSKKNNEKRQIEINGVKMEIDLREAKVIEAFKIGDKVKILKTDYYGTQPYPGVIVGFDNFEKYPTIIVMYLDREGRLEYAYINENKSDEKKIEMIHAAEDVIFERERVQEKLLSTIEAKERELIDAIRRYKYFIKHFGDNLDMDSIGSMLRKRAAKESSHDNTVLDSDFEYDEPLF